jgi:hypothetical protein
LRQGIRLELFETAALAPRIVHRPRATASALAV